MWKRAILDNKAVTGVFLITVIILSGCGSAPESNEWRTSRITESGTVAGLPLGSVLIGNPKQVGDDVEIHMVDTLCDEKECRLVAIGIDGQTYPGDRIARLGRASKRRFTVVVFSGVEIEDIQECQFQARPVGEGTDEVVTGKSKLSSAVRNRRLVDQICENRFFDSDSVN